ncbi:CPBP family intramembrane glutamic endopeptidase [Tissierella sp. Yu-01]|uniref:CPBP family intramembrane glutamic endopeptidase n=1 Tax=Tissierella sp. Yu-01 TaxID=3035694 RepID=UPI00240D2F28|nr:CPBP family intramembrane glutamic endopeptidase [Tissierella sp. Yu-01]WFA08247.1 CPBP family intramembrane metalloprotease [Tissierella sp. Yu-01]
MFEKRLYMRIWDAIKLLLLFAFFDFIFSIIITVISYKLKLDSSIFLLSSLSAIFALLLCIRSANKKYYLNIGERLNFRLESKAIIPALIITVIGLNIVISEVVNYITLLIPMSDFFEEIFSEILGGELNLTGTFIRVVIVAPIVEEILMRGIILEGLTSKYSNAKAIIVSSLLFGIIHLNIYQFVAASIIGILLGWIYINTNSLWLCIFTHGVYNSLGYIAESIFKIQIAGYTTEGFQPLWFTGVGLILIIFGGFLLKRIFKKKQYSYYF